MVWLGLVLFSCPGLINIRYFFGPFFDGECSGQETAIQQLSEGAVLGESEVAVEVGMRNKKQRDNHKPPSDITPHR